MSYREPAKQLPEVVKPAVEADLVPPAPKKFYSWEPFPKPNAAEIAQDQLGTICVRESLCSASGCTTHKMCGRRLCRCTCESSMALRCSRCGRFLELHPYRVSCP